MSDGIAVVGGHGYWVHAKNDDGHEGDAFALADSPEEAKAHIQEMQAERGSTEWHITGVRQVPDDAVTAMMVGVLSRAEFEAFYSADWSDEVWARNLATPIDELRKAAHEHRLPEQQPAYRSDEAKPAKKPWWKRR
jgi:hypothetical protein